MLLSFIYCRETGLKLVFKKSKSIFYCSFFPQSQATVFFFFLFFPSCFPAPQVKV